MNKIQAYKFEIRKYFGEENLKVSLFMKGRVALHSILKAMDIKKDDEVIIPSFTCVVVSNAIIYLGAKPIYAEIDPETMNASVAMMKTLITAKTKAIIAQNTFGLNSNYYEIAELCKGNNLFLIQDLAHGIGSDYQGELTGLQADAAFFSTQWNKVFSTGIGGVAITKNISIGERIESFEKKSIQPSVWDTATFIAQNFAHKKILSSRFYYPILNLYRLITHTGLIRGSNVGGEINSTQMPDDYQMKMTPYQAKYGIAGIKILKENINYRKAIAKRYLQIFNELNLPVHPSLQHEEHIFLVFSFFVKDRTLFLEKAKQAGVEITDWFNAPLHHVQSDLQNWYFDSEKFPITMKISRHIVNLPTSKRITDLEIDKIQKFLAENGNQIISYNECIK